MSGAATAQSSANGRVLALFVASTTGLVLALGGLYLPFEQAPGALSVFSEILYFLLLAGVLYIAGRLIRSVLSTHDE